MPNPIDYGQSVFSTNYTKPGSGLPGSGRSVDETNAGDMSLGEHVGGANQIAGQYANNAAAAQNTYAQGVTNQYVNADLAQTNAGLDQQQGNLQSLYQQANGLGGPSAAQQSVIQGGQRAAQNQYALANGLSGSAGALARRNAAMQGSAIGINANNTSNLIGAQERANALQQYTNALGAYRNQGQGAQAGAQQLAEAQGALNTNQYNINDQNTLGWQQLAQSAEQAQLQADSSIHNAQLGSTNAWEQTNNAARAANARATVSAGAGLMGGFLMSDARIKEGIRDESPVHPSEGTKSRLSADGIRGYLSDERVKTGMQPGHDSEADRFLDTMSPFSYRYKRVEDEPNSDAHGGRYLGVMAQKLEQGPTGDTLVRDTPSGKMLEGGALMSAMAAGEGRLHERLRHVESQLASMKRKR